MIFKPYPKQDEFFKAVASDKYKYLFYGGGVRGGKTFAGIAVLIMLAKIFPLSKWCVVRETHAQLRETSIPSFFKIITKNALQNWNGQHNVATFKNGSQIFFMSENYNADKELVWLDGLEINGFLLEEMQGLQRKTFDKVILRTGTHFINPQPPALVLGTFNPSQNFTKQLIYERYKNETLPVDWFYLPATVEDNYTQGIEQYKENLKGLPPDVYRRYVLGDWNVMDNERPFYYAFKFDKHISSDVERKPKETIYLSFDFNVDPITCIVAQHYEDKIRILNEYRLLNSDIYELCARIKTDYEDAFINVTGDASGKNRSALTRGNINYYQIIKKELYLGESQFKLMSANPSHTNSRALGNAILSHFDILISDKCKYLQNDLLLVEVDDDGGIASSKDKHQGHLLDAFRYYLFTFHNKKLKLL